MQSYFFDAHMHAMNLTHPNFVSFVDSVADSMSEFITSGALSPGYLLTPINRSQQGLITILNLFSLFELPVGKIFTVMEDDLKGEYKERQESFKGKKPPNLTYPDSPYIRDGKFHFRSKVYDKFGLIPLVMDFSRQLQADESKSYYTNEHQVKIINYVNDTLEGIRYYKNKRKEGLLEFFPFLGINPEVHSLQFIEQLLESYVEIDKKDQNKDKIFKGIKFYPPLGTNPWPEEKKERTKVEFIYSFCIENKLGIITHCDDQGFRGVTAKTAQQYTNPTSWIEVFKRYPKLKVDFAHYGRQYNPIGKSPLKVLLDRSFTTDPWFTQIIEFMGEYENVYADFSFSGTEIEFYQQLHHFIENLEDKSLAQKIKERSMFGSDFSINLAKVESYTNYLRIFEESPFNDEEVDLFASVNPTRFLSQEN